MSHPQSQRPPGLIDEAPAGDGFGLRRRGAPSVKKHQSEGWAGEGDAAQPASHPPFGPVAGGTEGAVDSLIGGAMMSSKESKEHQWALTTIDSHFRYFAWGAICAYITLVLTVYLIVPPENIVRLEGAEQNAAIMAMSLIGMSLISRLFPLLGWVTGGIQRSKSAKKKTNISGIVVGGLTVQLIAFTTDFLMAFFPTPVLMDPVLGTRVHILRWCEWTPCATFMTFMTEGADMYWSGTQPPPDFLRAKYIHASTQGAAVFLGLLFPFCPGFKTWIACLVVSCFMYLTNYPRMWNRQRDVPKTLRDGATLVEQERFNAAKIGLRLRYVTVTIWSLIVALFFASSVGPNYAPEGSLLHSHATNMVCECFFDVLSKVLFLIFIMDVHSAIFDPYERTQRRLEELQRLLNSVWDSSGDIIAIAVRAGPSSNASLMLSPAFGRLEAKNRKFQKKTILYELSNEAFQTAGVKEEELSGPKVEPDMISCIEETTSISNMNDVSVGVNPDIGALRAVSDVIVKAWGCDDAEQNFSHTLQWGDSSFDFAKHRIFTEAKASRLDETSLVVILRDISERVRAFEAEKKILFDTTSRQKDAEANRFTRHEVKNGLLSAIGLYESLCDAQRSQLTKFQGMANDGGFGLDLGEPLDHSDDIVRCMNELGKSLNETLETILVETMTKDLVHGLYRPHRESINVSSVLSGSFEDHSMDVGGVGNFTRFPLMTRPSPLPLLYLDPQILRYLHRQVLSNACKYGKIGGVVLTEIFYDQDQEKMTINVVNLPGDHHKRLVDMGSEAEESVFSKGCQIHQNFHADYGENSKQRDTSAQPGDGGWMMLKCAKLMKGGCSIKFLASKTVFSCNFPARPHKRHTKTQTPMDVKTFTLPVRTWGIAIDDSKVQMKLLGKFFEFAKIPEDRISVFGQTPDEIMGFVDYVVEFMDEHKGDHVLLIADENLDLIDAESSKCVTLSGSQLVENIRSRLLPEQERLLVALIRSANDSATDVAIYNSRAHGFLPKAPIKKGKVLEALAPLWMARYPGEVAEDETQSGTDTRPRSNSFSSLESSNTGGRESLAEFIGTTPIEISQMIREIDSLFMNGHFENWSPIWDKLHVLKGDLLTLNVGSRVISAVGTINSFRELHSNKDLYERWSIFRDNTLAWLDETN